ncbi:hypothetical protein RQP46_004339 [Phenoliferia psychrophenolica]
MATFTDLSPELLSHILKLSTQGEHPSEEQRARFQFGLIARAFYLATTNATVFYVSGGRQAKALVTRIEREEEERKSGQLGRATPSTWTALCSTRVTNIRQLSVVIKVRDDMRCVFSLLRAFPDLVAFDLDVEALSAAGATPLLATLEVAVARLTSLRKLSFHSYRLSMTALFRILIPLKDLEVLSIGCREYFQEEFNLVTLELPRLRALRISVVWSRPVPDTLIHALATTSTTGLKVLDLASNPYSTLSSIGLDHLLPHVTTITYFTWTPPSSYPIQNSVRDRVLALLGAMNCLKYISIRTWQASGDRFLDHTLFDTLATLPILHTADIFVQQGRPDEETLVSFIKACQSLCFLSMDVPDGWSQEKWDAVQEAAEGAGVVFKYTRRSRWM